MRPSKLHVEDLVFANEASAATGVPEAVIRKWASRGKIQRFTGEHRLTGNGHEYKTMYALPEIAERAASYRPTPQRGQRAA